MGSPYGRGQILIAVVLIWSILDDFNSYSETIHVK